MVLLHWFLCKINDLRPIPQYLSSNIVKWVFTLNDDEITENLCRLRYYDVMNLVYVTGELGEIAGEDRIPFQADKAELPSEILLWLECKCHHDTDMGHTHSQSAPIHPSKLSKKDMEFIRHGNNSAYYTDVLSES